MSEEDRNQDQDQDRIKIEERERWIKEQGRNNFFPTKVLNEETGLSDDFLVSYCFNCDYLQTSRRKRLSDKDFQMNTMGLRFKE